MRFNNDVPFEAFYQSSRKEASRKKPIFFIHKYFARRITTNFRLAMLDYFYDDSKLIDHFYEPSGNKGAGTTILDPFMGGGTTIFEALRFGCNVIGCDLQPLSLFVTKALVEPIDETAVLNAVKRLKDTVGEKIRSYYKTTCPCCGKKADGMYAFHVKKVSTPTACREHKLFSSFVIAYKNDEFTIVCPKCGKLHKTKFENGFFECECGWRLNSPKDGYIKNGVFECPECHEHKKISEYDSETGYPFSSDIIAIEYYCPNCKAHDYKSPDSEDLELQAKAMDDYEHLRLSLPIPQQIIPAGYNTNQIINHGYRRFSDLFNKRQLLCLGLLLKEINELNDIHVQLWLQLAFSGMLEMNNMFCRYQQNAYKICNIFFNHAYVPITMPVENCVWGAELGTGTFEKTMQKIIRGKRFNNNIYDLSSKKAANGRYESLQIENGDTVQVVPTVDYASLSADHPILKCTDSRDLSFVPDESVDLVITDPPYGANVMYSELIDFFHVWNHNSSIADQIGFTTELSPKDSEIVVNTIAGKDFQYYQDGITSVLSECNKKLKPDGYLVFSFHDKSIDSWLAVLGSISSAGFSICKVYPVQAETRTGAHTSGKNSIGIDIMLVCQKKAYQAIQLRFVDYDAINCIIDDTKRRVVGFIERFQTVDAELTVPDIQNMAIAVFFNQIGDLHVYDAATKEKIIRELQTLLDNIESFTEDYEIAKKRSGWWSELYRQKWATTDKK